MLYNTHIGVVILGVYSRAREDPLNMTFLRTEIPIHGSTHIAGRSEAKLFRKRSRDIRAKSFQT